MAVSKGYRCTERHIMLQENRNDGFPAVTNEWDLRIFARLA